MSIARWEKQKKEKKNHIRGSQAEEILCPPSGYFSSLFRMPFQTTNCILNFQASSQV